MYIVIRSSSPLAPTPKLVEASSKNAYSIIPTFHFRQGNSQFYSIATKNRNHVMSPQNFLKVKIKYNINGS